MKYYGGHSRKKSQRLALSCDLLFFFSYSSFINNVSNFEFGLLVRRKSFNTYLSDAHGT